MKAYWWQAGIHLEPESKEEREYLAGLLAVLDCVRVGHQVESPPLGVIETGYQEPVVGAHKLTDMGS